MNNFDTILSKLPTETKIVRFITGENGEGEDGLNIQSVEVLDISSLALPNVVACNIILNCFMACFGIDVCSIAREAVQSTDYRLVDMQNLLIHSKWDTTNVTINGVTKKAYEWIKYRFHIYSKENFVNQLYRRITDICLKGENTDEGVIIKTDNDTYQMIKLIAYCFGGDVNFSSVPIGDTTVIPNQRYSTKEELETILKKLFFDMGLIAENTTITIPSNMWSGSDSSRAYLNQKSYATVLIHKGKCDNPLNVVYPTDPDFHEMWTYTIVTSTNPVTSLVLDGFTHTSSDNWNITDAGSSYNTLYCWQTTFTIAIENSGSNSVFSMMKAFEIGTSENVLNLTYKNYSSFRWGEYYSGDRTKIYLPLPWRWYRQQGTMYWNNIQTADQITTDIYLNCSYSIGEDVPAPVTDNTLLSDLDDIDLLMTKWFSMLTLTTQGILEALKTRASMVNTTIALKTDLIDINNGISIRTSKPITLIKEDNALDYITRFKTAIVPYENHADTYKNNLSERAYVLNGTAEINNFNSYLWDKDFLDKLVQYGNGYNPLDCVDNVIRLPFELKEGSDFVKEQEVISAGGFPMDLPNHPQVHGHSLDSYFKVLRTEPVPIGFKNKDDDGQEKEVYEPESYLNYEPYTKAKIYIPFVGERELDMSMIMYKWVYLEYRVYVPTGDFVATVNVYDSNDTVEDTTTANYGMIGSDEAYRCLPVLTCNGNMAYKMKIAGKATSDALGAITNVISALSHASHGMVGGAINDITNATSNVAGVNHVENTGTNQTNITNILSNWKPYITLYKHEAIRGYTTDTKTAFMQTIGKKSERGVTIKNMGEGFHKVKGVKLEGLRCTSGEKKIIEDILKNGFFIGSKKS